MNLDKLGWDYFFQDQFRIIQSEGDLVGRIVLVQSSNYTMITEAGVLKGKLSGKFRNSIKRKNQYPAVGDWVVFHNRIDVDEVFIKAILPRKSRFVRKLPISGGRKLKNGIISGGIIEEQVICSNIDIAFIVTGLDHDFDIHRIERYITLVYNCGSSPVLLLNKADICESASAYLESVRKIALDLPIHLLSAVTDRVMDIIGPYLSEGKTAVFLGSSGVGKSTLINALLGESRQKTNQISTATGKGKHTTVKTELILHPDGSIIIDTPGLRELQLWGSIEALNQSYKDIFELSLECKYKDCRHDMEPNCAVKKAIEDDRISYDRFESYKKQLTELTKLDQNRIDYDKSLNKKEKFRMKLKKFK